MPSFIGFWELLALAAVLLLLFGPRRLPEIGRSLGRGMREFKESVTAPLDRIDAPDEHDTATTARFQEAPGGPLRADRIAPSATASSDAVDDEPMPEQAAA